MANVFETAERKIIPAVLIYAFYEGKVLMLHRNARGAELRDDHAGKWNGLGGKLEKDESPFVAAQREFSEEAGIVLSERYFRCVGVLQFPNFKAHKSEDWWVSVFRVNFTEKDQAKVNSVRSICDEGTLEWIPEIELLNRPLWEGDHRFLPLVIEGRAFIGTFWYDGEGAAAPTEKRLKSFEMHLL
jgi:8-oxo-dGTP diphosphatase